MAIIIAVAGDMNSGKSSGRDFMRRPDQQFILSNSIKDLHLEGVEHKRLIAGVKGHPVEKIKEVDKKYRDADSYPLWLNKIMNEGSPESTIAVGNYDYCQINEIGTYIRFVSEFYPAVKELHIEDLTHFITARITSEEFRGRKKGDEAFARYVDVASDFMNNTMHMTRDLRKDLVVLFYYHTIWSEDEQKYNIRVPGGKLLEEKFFPGSYFDHMLMSRFIRNEHAPELEYEDRFRYIIRPGDRYSGRTKRTAFPGIADLPNDLQHFIDVVRRKSLIPLDHTPELDAVPGVKTNLTIGVPEI